MRRIALCIIGLLSLLGAGPAAAQALQLCEQGADSADTASRVPIARLTASAQIAEVRFTTAPRVRIYLPGCDENTIRTTERRNLPSPVVPGVTYRDVSVGVEISSYLRVSCNLPALSRNGASPLAAAAAELRALCGGVAPDSVPPALPAAPR